MKKKTNNVAPTDVLEVQGARVHNLKNIDLSIPREKLVVFTGLSGSGKSSLAFDTIYAEGQRRYIETFSAYARQFLGGLERPDVDKIDGLSPVIAIEQKTTSKSPRSTVGTITEIYDFLRLLFARASDAYSYITGEKMVSYTDSQIQELITKEYKGKRINLLAPVVQSRKGHYRELFEQIAKQGFVKVRTDGEIRDIEKGMKLDRYKTHDIEIVIDRMLIDDTDDTQKRLQESIKIAMNYGDDVLMVLEHDQKKAHYFSRHLMCPSSGISYPLPEPNTFSFNSPKGMCPHCNGLGEVQEINLSKIIPDPSISIKNGGITAVGEQKNTWIFKQLELIVQKFGHKLSDPIETLPKEAMDIILYGGKDKYAIKSDVLGITRNFEIDFEGIINFIKSQHENADMVAIKRWAEEFMDTIPCEECHGTRLRKEALYFKIADKNIAELSALDITDLLAWFKSLPEHLSTKQRKIAEEIIKEITTRLQFLIDVGLTYLALNRSSKSLSGGEAQRIRLATQIGSQLTGVLYILDEPSIGLHQRDNKRLINSLKSLRDIGNSVIVVEHDEDIMKAADYIIDIGPEAGTLGGEVVATGTYEEILKAPTLTGEYLSGRRTIEMPKKARTSKHFIKIKGARANNLKNIDVTFPLDMLTVVTGVSGSGKSTLVKNILYPALLRKLDQPTDKIGEYSSMDGKFSHIKRVEFVDQNPIGKSTRSNPVTYIKAYDDIRQLFASQKLAKMRGYTAKHFSFNTEGGRCETCKGEGEVTIEMQFMADVHLTCEACGGKRFKKEVLEITYEGKNIDDLLNTTIDDAVAFFAAHKQTKIAEKLKPLQDVGLGYVTLGQSSSTLSGGEAQRIKLASFLSKSESKEKVLFIFDEPTTGLHFHDIRKLLDSLQALIEKGHSVIVIEHNLEMIKCADYIIDLGLEGGEKGGSIIAKGTPEEIAKCKESYTGIALANDK